MKGQKQLIDERCSFSRNDAGATGHQKTKKKKTKTKQNKTITYVSHVIQKVIKNVLQGFPCAGGLGSILGQGTRSHMPQ